MILIRINEYEIGEQEYLAEVGKLCTQEGMEKPNKLIVQKAVSNLIEGYLVLEQAMKSSVTVSEDELQHEIIEYMMEYENHQKYRDDLEEFNVSNDQLKKHFKNKLLISKYLDSQINIPEDTDEQRLHELYRQNVQSFKMSEVIRVSHILIKHEKGYDKAKEIRDRINTQEDFHDLVGRCSNCPSCLQAGDLGYIAKSKMVPEFDEVAFQLDLFEISQPITTKFGYHIIMVTDKKKEVTLSYEDVKDTLKSRLKEIEYELGVMKLIEKLKEQADIYVNKMVWNYFE